MSNDSWLFPIQRSIHGTEHGVVRVKASSFAEALAAFRALPSEHIEPFAETFDTYAACGLWVANEREIKKLIKQWENS